ncbi:MAG: alpha-E domain-containing protein [Eubacteriales bacterium]|nr:alpha-E domain-containing protein [Eubacteriales bacterium]
MGVKSVENMDRLYWLGRYSERVYTTLKLYGQRFDSMLEEGTEGYDEFCRSLEIPNIYASAEDFRKQYPFGHEDPNSIYSNLRRAYDNAIELREEIGSETLAYIQLAVYELNKASLSEAPMIEFQRILDDILAFWGIVDDQIEDEDTRNIIKVGKRVERIDLYGRLNIDRVSMIREVNRLCGRIERCSLHYNKAVPDRLKSLVAKQELDYPEIVREIERILEV